MSEVRLIECRFSLQTYNGCQSWSRHDEYETVLCGMLVVVETGDGSYDFEKNQYADSVLVLSPTDLKLLDYYTPENRTWITRKDLDMGSFGPTVFLFRDWELIAAAGKEGVVYLLDAKSPGGADHRTPLYRSPLFANEEVNFAGKGFWGAFSTWQDGGGTRWLYAPAWGPPAPAAKFPLQYGATPNGSVMAFKVEVQNNTPILTPVWNSTDMSLPTPAVIANGMVFVLSDGDDPVQVNSNAVLLNWMHARREPAMRCCTSWTPQPARYCSIVATPSKASRTSAA
jgi:hypothetical protein